VGFVLVGLAVPALAFAIALTIASSVLSATAHGTGESEGSGWLFLMAVLVGCPGFAFLMLGLIFIAVLLARPQSRPERVPVTPRQLVTIAMGVVGIVLIAATFYFTLSHTGQAYDTPAKVVLYLAGVLSALAVIISTRDLRQARSPLGLPFLGLLIGMTGLTIALFYLFGEYLLIVL
jgi:hypothetical protein